MDSPKKTVSIEAMQEEWSLIQKAQKNPARFQPLYEHYYEAIFRFIFRRTANENLTADLCSRVFLKALQRLGSYQYKGVPFSAWLYRIASNEVSQYFRDLQKDRLISIDESNFSELAEEIEEDRQHQFRSALINALDDLKESEVTIIEMRFFEQRPFKEIADILGITESNAKVKTYRILKKLKKMIIKEHPD